MVAMADAHLSCTSSTSSSEDAQLAVGVLAVAERVLHLHLGAVLGVGEVIVAHGNGRVAQQLDVVVVEDDVRPALAAVDGEALVLLEAAGDRVAAHKVRHGVVGHRAELVLGALGRLEEHAGAAVAVELVSRVAGRRDEVAAVEVGPANGLDRARPRRLCRPNLLLGHGGAVGS
eukprot:scaffold11920_cov108-Isochrysis_galbana.AAC.3